MKRIIQTVGIAGAMLLSPHAASATDAKGSWMGTLVVDAANKLRVRVRIQAGPNGALIGALDSLDQGASGIPLADIVATDTNLSFAVPMVKGRFEGKWDETKRGWAGQWSQGGPSLPLLLTAAPPPPPPPPVPANWSIPNDAAIGTLLELRLAGRDGAGLVAGILDGGRHRLVARGPAGAAAFTGTTIFEIGSITKVFTSLLLADMVQRGEVSLDDPAEKYLPEGRKMPERGGRKITLLDLANQHSGLPRLPDNFAPADMGNPYADYDEARLLNFLGRYQLTRDIGSQYEYSNLGVGLLGYLLARRAGTSYEELLKRRITGPLGMRDTVITLSPEQQRRFAQGHDAFMRPAKAWDLSALAGCGAIRSTVNDLLLLMDAFTGNWQTSLAPAMKLMLEQRWPTDSPYMEIGLAWHVLNVPGTSMVWHNGGTGGFSSMMAFDPARKRGAIILANSTTSPTPDDLVRHLLVGLPVAPTGPVPKPPPAR